MSTKNPNLAKLGKETIANWCAITEREIAKQFNATYCGGINDGGVDAITPDGKKIQIKTLFENSSSITFNFEFCKNAKIHKNNHYLFKQELKKYLRKFDILAVYIGKYRGDDFDINNLLIINDKDEMFDWVCKHGHRAYMKYANGTTYKAQIQLRKTACGDINKVVVED